MQEYEINQRMSSNGLLIEIRNQAKHWCKVKTLPENLDEVSTFYGFKDYDHVSGYIRNQIVSGFRVG